MSGLVDFFDILKPILSIKSDFEAPADSPMGHKLAQDRSRKNDRSTINGMGAHILGAALIPALVLLRGNHQIDKDSIQG